jgi:hypothetical protein
MSYVLFVQTLIKIRALNESKRFEQDGRMAIHLKESIENYA